jgi:Phytanoyl-CoA dioxygenase (PhyH)
MFGASSSGPRLRSAKEGPVVADLEGLRREGFVVLPGFIAPARVARLRELADGLRARYLQRDPATGRRGFLVSGWSITHVEHPGFYEGAADWWFPELASLIADPEILDLWRTATGDEPDFACAALYIDPPMPYAVDSAMQQTAAPDGAGSWHRDRTGQRADDVEKADLLRTERLREGGYLLEIALLPSDAFEYVPGSHARWDTALELQARKLGATVGECTQPLPGARRISIGPGDALLADTSGIHRGWYTHGVPRRTIALSYLSSERLRRYPAEGGNRSLLDAGQLSGLDPATRVFFARDVITR